MTPRPLGMALHVALAVPAAACALPAVALHVLDAPGRPDTYEAMTICAAAVAALLAAVVVVRWWRRGTPFHERVVAGSVYETVVAGLAGLSIGGYAGTMWSVGVGGLHVSTAAAYLVFLPVAILVCCARRPVWRPYLDVTALMAGVEVGVQGGLMLTEFRAFRWWEDISGMNAAFWVGGASAAGIAVALRHGRAEPEPEAPAAGTAPPRRARAR